MKRTSRRSFVRIAVVFGSGAVLAACGQAAAPTAAPTAAPAKPAAAEPTKPAAAPAAAEPTKPAAAAAPAATTAPAAAAAPKPAGGGITLSFWNGLTGADGQIMDQLLQKMTGATGVK